MAKKSAKRTRSKQSGPTPKQRRFAAEYLVDLNATQAAIRSGYSPKAAPAQGCRLLMNAKVAALIAEGSRKVADRLEVTQDRVLKEYARLAFLDIRKAFDAKGNLLPIKDLDDDTAAAIAGLEVEALYEGKGAARDLAGHLHKIKLSDKRGALDSLARHLGMFIDRTEVTGKDGGPIEVDATHRAVAERELDEWRREMAAKLSSTPSAPPTAPTSSTPTG